MSRGFVREGDQEVMPIIPPRAILPEGMTNYMTPTGMEELLSEKAEMESEKKALQKSEEDNRVPIRVLDIKLSNIQDRIDTAELIEPMTETPVEARFGTVVSYRLGDAGPVNTFRIVGVDEANPSKGKITFTAPIARAMMGLKKGDSTTFDLGGESRAMTIIDITK